MSDRSRIWGGYAYILYAIANEDATTCINFAAKRKAKRKWNVSIKYNIAIKRR